MAAVAAAEEEEKERSRLCRICFEGESDAGLGPLLSPCDCRGSQGLVHEACLLKWRQLQVFQGKLSAASRCEICGAKYASTAPRPERPFAAVAQDFGRVLLETLLSLGLYVQKSCLLSFLVFTVLPTWHFGVLRVCGSFSLVLSLLVLALYAKGMKLSVLHTPGNNFRLSLTCFGPPVEGLSNGMLLVSIRAGGPFHRTVLLVLEHNDFGSLALILNKSAPSIPNVERNLDMSYRDGGPVPVGAIFCVHDVEDVPSAERLIRGERIFLSRTRASLEALKGLAARQAGAELPPRRAVVFKGVSSWGERQLEGELRRCAWGWISPEHVRAEDILEMDQERLSGLWERLIDSPHLQTFQG